MTVDFRWLARRRTNTAIRPELLSAHPANMLFTCIAWVVRGVEEGCAGRANSRAFHNCLGIPGAGKMDSAGRFGIVTSGRQGLKLLFVPSDSVREIPHAGQHE